MEYNCLLYAQNTKHNSQIHFIMKPHRIFRIQDVYIPTRHP